MMTAAIHSMADLLDVIRAKRDALNISHETIDNLAGLPAGYTSKVLAPIPIRGIGYTSLGDILGALAIALVPVEDTAQRIKVEGRWQKRKRPQKLASASISASILSGVQITPELQAKLGLTEHMKKIASSGGKRRAKLMGKRARQRAASHAARMRWSKRVDA